jgi:outer membrane protein insertion porin family
MISSVPSRFWSWRALRAGARVLVALHVAAAGAAAADDTIIVHGNRRIDADVIRAHFPATQAEAVRPAAVDAALKELFATGLFEDVRVVPSGARLIVTVVEASVIAHLRFEGNKKIKDEDLQKAITLRPRDPMTKAAVQKDVVTLTDLYRKSGRHEAQVTPKTISRGSDQMDLVFEIREGAKTGVKQLLFVGNRTFSASRLKTVVTTTESGWFAFLKTSDVYDTDRLENDDDLVHRFYVKNGFADARVTASGVYDPAQQGFVVIFKIDEGERYRFGTIDIASRVSGIDGAALRTMVHIAPGDAYDGEAIGKAVDDITVAVGKLGFPFVEVRPHANRDIGAKAINIVLTLDDGPRIYVERIAIHGNYATREEVIRREFDIAEGDALNRALIARAEKRLKALRLFRSVKTSIAEGAAPDRVVLNVDVEEDRTGDFSFSGGYSTQYGVLGEVSVSEQNFLGHGQYVKASVALGQYLRSGTLSFVEPYLLGNRMSLGLDLYYKETLTNSTQSYGSTAYGSTIRIGAPLTDSITTEARYSIVNQSLSLDPTLLYCVPGVSATPCASAAVRQEVLDGPAWLSMVGSSIKYNSLDDPKHPHEGIRAEIRQDVAGLGGSVDFLKTTGDIRYYHDLGNDVVGVVRAQGGYITPFGGQTLPFVNGFFGGPQIVRGFAVNGFGPRDLTPGTTMDNIGGSAYWATSAELQTPIPGLPPEIALKAAAFADAGSLWGYRGATSFPSLSQSLTVADTRQVRSSIGSGLIWDSPFGPLRVDYAYPISKTSYDVTQRLFFGFGGF